MTYDLLIGQQSYSSWSLRGWLAFAPFDIPVTLHKVEIYGPTFYEDVAAFGAARTVPAARTPEGGMLTDSMAIVWHVAEAFADRGVMPKGAQERAEAMSIISEMHDGFKALRAACPVNLRNAWAGFEASPEVLADVARFEDILSRVITRSGGPFLFGSFTLADAFYAPLATRLLTYGLPMSNTAKAYAKAIVTHPSFVEWREAGMKETQEIARYDKAPLERVPFPTFS
ncbi:glutathione S-transferase [Rhodobacteraceae bacterium N5(2021)]|uniref:Glutathione S-transferase n=1 Tax=Gymnodinialimonas phycosphaerae TaxID=2841589 RepID=A0A975YFK9_9RHOB|nr:glutathione S-transferase [Gymnodinialimonas phycosphaerae]MBY4894948.1 glutathione S-transferase [Gymnodinialimonas phycosphaerae]